MIYFDTSVIMAILDPTQEAHVGAVSIFNSLRETETICTTTLHTYAELYSNMTRKGGGRPAIPPKNMVTVLGRLSDSFQMVELNKADYLAAVQRCADLGLIRAIIYDALHYQAALKAGASVLYTDNLKNFTRLQLDGDELEVRGVRK